jgi:hypothetical protein
VIAVAAVREGRCSVLFLWSVNWCFSAVSQKPRDLAGGGAFQWITAS